MQIELAYKQMVGRTHCKDRIAEKQRLLEKLTT